MPDQPAKAAVGEASRPCKIMAAALHTNKAWKRYQYSSQGGGTYFFVNGTY
jgi:hypothetical protein